MNKFVLIVEFQVKPDSLEKFNQAIAINAKASVSEEPGCRQFDVLTPEAGPGDRITLYEIYDDAAAFDAHLATPHFATFNDATAPLVAAKTVHRLGFASPS